MHMRELIVKGERVAGLFFRADRLARTEAGGTRRGMPSVDDEKPPFTTPVAAAATAPRKARGDRRWQLQMAQDPRDKNRRIRDRRAQPETPRQPRMGQYVDAETAPHQAAPGHGVPVRKLFGPGARPVMSAGAAATPAGPDLDDGQWMFLSAAAAGQGRTVADSAPASARRPTGRTDLSVRADARSRVRTALGSDTPPDRRAAGGRGLAPSGERRQRQGFERDGFGSAQQGRRRASRPSTPRRSILAECASTGRADRRWRRPRASSTRRRPVMSRARRTRRARTGPADRSVRADAGRRIDRTTGPPWRPSREHAVTRIRWVLRAQRRSRQPRQHIERLELGGVVQSGRGRQGKPDAAGGGQLKGSCATGGCRTYRRRPFQPVPPIAGYPRGSALEVEAAVAA